MEKSSPAAASTCRESSPTRVRIRVVSWDPTRLKLCLMLRHGAVAPNSRIVSITEEPPRRGTMSGEPRNFGAKSLSRNQVQMGLVNPA